MTTKASIAIVARKGGVGKSTIAGNLAVALEQLGRTVAAYDLDAQGSLAAWAELAEPGTEPALARLVRRLEATDAGRLRTAIERTDAERVLLDTAPGYDRAALATLLVADLVLIPAGPSPLDVIAARDALALVEQSREQRHDKGPAVALVPSRVTRSGLGDELPTGLRALGAPVLPAIRLRTAFARSALDGRTVLEAEPSSSAADEIRALTRAVERMLKGR